MAKGHSSSASSATRKKHASKKSKKGDTDEGPSQPPPKETQKKSSSKKTKKPSRFEPKVKRYIPPPPPPKGLPDPVDLYLSGSSTHPELVVILRRLHKRDEATLSKGIEGFQTWLDDHPEDDFSEEINVWAHHFPKFALHPSRRLRLLAMTLHQRLVASSELRAILLRPQWVEASNLVGAWACAASDVDRGVRLVAQTSWDVAFAPWKAERDNVSDVETKVVVPPEDSLLPVITFSVDAVLGIIDEPALQLLLTEAVEDPDYLRTSALGALSKALLELDWPLVQDVLEKYNPETLENMTSDDFWAVLEVPSASSRAAYGLLDVMVSKQLLSALVQVRDDLVDHLSKIILSSVWTRIDAWPQVVAFLRSYPQAWTSPSGDEEDSPDQEGSFQSSAHESQALSGLLQHLRTACSGHPELYPTVLLLLSTLPLDLLRVEASTLVGALWDAHTHRAVSLTRRAVDQFATAFLECLSFVTAKVDDAERLSLINEYTTALWSAYLGLEKDDSSSPTGNKNVLSLLISHFDQLASSGDLEDLWNSKLKALALSVLALQEEGHSDSYRALESAVSVGFVKSSSPDLLHLLSELAQEIARVALIRFEDTLSFTSSLKLANAELEALDRHLQAVPDELLAISRKLVSDRLIPRLYELVDDPTSVSSHLHFIVDHIKREPDVTKANALWSSLCGAVERFEMSLLSDFVFYTTQQHLHSRLQRLDSGGLDALFLDIARRTLSQHEPAGLELEVLRAIIKNPAPLASSTLPQTLADMVLTALSEGSNHSLKGQDTIGGLAFPAALLAEYSRTVSECDLLSYETLVTLQKARLAASLNQDGQDTLRSLDATWERILQAGPDRKNFFFSASVDVLRESLLDSDIVLDPPSIVDHYENLWKDLKESDQVQKITYEALLPPGNILDQWVTEKADIEYPKASLYVHDPSLTRSFSDSAERPSETDENPQRHTHALTPLVRVIVAVADIAARDNSFSATNVFLSVYLKYVVLVGEVAGDVFLDGSSELSVGSSSFVPGLSSEISAACRALSLHALSRQADVLTEEWHVKLVERLKGGGGEKKEEDEAIFGVLSELYSQWTPTGYGFYTVRVFGAILGRALDVNGEKVDGVVSVWLGWISDTLSLRSKEGPSRKVVDFSYVLLHILKKMAGERGQNQLERLGNELAGALTMVSPRDAFQSERGLDLLQILLASAPELDDMRVLVSAKQRATFLLRHLREWIESDEAGEGHEKLAGSLLELFRHLAPVVQDLIGSHWGMMLAVVESAFEESEIVTLYEACELLLDIQGLSERNSELRTHIKEDLSEAVAAARHFFLFYGGLGGGGVPERKMVASLCRLVTRAPGGFAGSETSETLDCLLGHLRSPLYLFQYASFSLLKDIIKIIVDEAVIETALQRDSEVDATPAEDVTQLAKTETRRGLELPNSLIHMLTEPENLPTYTFVFSWLSLFEFFRHASGPTVQTLLDSTRNLGIVGRHLMPWIVTELGLVERNRMVDVSPWALNEFAFETVSDGSETERVDVLAAYVFYSALEFVPLLVREWWMECKSRQTSLAVSTFTSRNLSPLLISSELSTVTGTVMDQLRDNDDFKVRVLEKTGEVKAAFTVDEQTLELGLRLPEEFPLTPVDVSDGGGGSSSLSSGSASTSNKIGVTEAQWRSWMLSMRTMMSSHGYTLADALVVFKKNVTLHFEGVEECSICYSIISVVDRSLPTKTCRICHHRFHPGCLYKWFSTSHGSSCPLCRSLF